MRQKKAYKGISLKILMTETTNKYHRSKIYAIRSLMTDKFYIGSTTNVLSKRMAVHRNNYKTYKEGNFPNLSSFIILQYPDAKIELMEAFKCENRNEIVKREGELIREHRNNCVNINIAGRTKKEWCEVNKDRLSKQRKTKITCSCGTITDYCNKARHEQTPKHINFTSQINI